MPPLDLSKPMPKLTITVRECRMVWSYAFGVNSPYMPGLRLVVHGSEAIVGYDGIGRRVYARGTTSETA